MLAFLFGVRKSNKTVGADIIRPLKSNLSVSFAYSFLYTRKPTLCKSFFTERSRPFPTVASGNLFPLIRQNLWFCHLPPREG